MRRPLNCQVVPLDQVPSNKSDDKREHSRLDILIVDDEHIIADTLSMILTQSGFRTMVAYEGNTALRIAADYRPALLITDVVMPEMTGIELAMALGTIVPECKVLLFSGQAATVDLLAKAREMGREFTIISKPIHPAEMIRRVSEYVAPTGKEDLVSVN